MKIELLTVGRMRKGAHADLAQDYLRRLTWPLSVLEVESKYKGGPQAQADELEQIKKHISPSSFVVCLDERGKNLSSRELAAMFENLQLNNRTHVQFLIGGADGLDDPVRQRADLLLSFGKLTWPHMLARVMLLEQIYRAQQILKNHPYHRD